MDMEQFVSGVADTRDVVSPVPTDAQHPKMYEWTVYLLGGIVALCVVALFVLAFAGKGSEAVTTGLISIALLCGGGLVNLLKTRGA